MAAKNKAEATEEQTAPSINDRLREIDEVLNRSANICDTLLTRPMVSRELDKLDLTGGYTRDNVVLCCYVANVGRNHNTVYEFRSFIKVLKDNLCCCEEPDGR